MAPPTSHRPEKDPQRSGVRGWLVLLASGLGAWLWRRWKSKQTPPARSTPDEANASADAPPSGTTRDEVVEKRRGALHDLEVDAESVRRGHVPEQSLDVRPIVVAVGAFLALVAVALAAVAWLVHAMNENERAAAARAEGPFADYRAVPPPPRLQAEPALDLQALRRWEDAVLSTYARHADGTFRIPIDRALALVVAEGLPVDSPAAADTFSSDALVPTESGWTRPRRGPRPPTAPAYLGQSPEPDAPYPRAAERLGVLRTPPPPRVPPPPESLAVPPTRRER